MDGPILVIGATGRHGGTGSMVADALLGRRLAVRALVRVDDDRAAELRRRGAETVVGDLHDRPSLVAAVAGVGAIYFTYPVANGIISAAANLASVLTARNSPVHLVVMSMSPSSPDSPSKLGRAAAVAEEIFVWAGRNPTVLRFAGLFHENVLLLHETSIREEALIANSFGEAPAPWIGARDAAEITIGHLLAPPPTSPQINYPPPAEAITHAEVARIISTEIDRPLRYRHISAAEWRQQLAAAADTDPASPVNKAMAQHISTLGGVLSTTMQSTIAPDPAALTALLNRPPARFAEFVRQNLDRFAGTSGLNPTQ